MSAGRGTWLILCIALKIFCSGSAGFAASKTQGAEPPLKITVRVYNYARVPGTTLTKAERKAARILRRAGVETAWHQGPLSQAEAEGNPAFKGSLGPSGLNLRILPRSMSERLELPSTCLGYAQTSATAKFPSIAGVFLNRVLALAFLGGDRISALRTILAHVIAHEIGHLLLERNAHSRTGIMSVPWKRHHLRLAAVEHLLFTDEEAARMRANVRERVKSEGAP